MEIARSCFLSREETKAEQLVKGMYVEGNTRR